MKKLPAPLLALLFTTASVATASVAVASVAVAGRPETPAVPATVAATATERQTREVAPFTAVNAAGSMNVIVRQGSPQRVEVEASAADQAKVETEVEGGRLRVGRRREGREMWKIEKFNGPVFVYVTVPSLTAVSVSGSGDLRVEGPVQAGDFQVSVAGSGNLFLPQLTAQTLKTGLAGSGNISLGGTCPRHSIGVAGSGNVRADNLRTDDTEVRISGSGSVQVNAAKTLNSRISGSGDVLLRGAAQISTSKSGSGSVRRL